MGSGNGVDPRHGAPRMVDHSPAGRGAGSRFSQGSLGEAQVTPPLGALTSRTGRGQMFQAPTLWYWVTTAPGKEGSAQRDQTPF